MEQQSPVGRIWQWGEAEHGRLITAVVLAVLGTVCGMVPYFAAAKIITLLLAGEQALNAYTPWLLTALCGYLLRTVLYNSALSISHKATYNILKTIRQMLLAKLPKLPLGTVMDTSSGKLKQTIVDQVDGMETTLAHLFPEMTANIAAPVLTIVYLFVLDWRLALLSLVVFPVAFFFMMTVMGGYGKDYAGAVQATNEMSSILIEYINGIEVIKAFNFVDTLAQVGTIVGQVDEILCAEEQEHGSTPVTFAGHDIVLQNVSFGYHADKEILHDVSLTIPAGKMTALVGPSGSGKSTIAKLAAGFWDVKQGTITLGGRDLKTIPLQQLYEQTAYVSQDNYLFDDTVRENIRMGRLNATDAEVEAAAHAAGCDRFIQELEHGYDTRVGGGGAHLSGGERQRIAIARAMLKDAPVILLDEATAYIDPENEAIIQKAVGRLVKNKTVIVIAHRLSTIVDAANIAVVQDGRIAAQGTHAQLLESSPLYRGMWQAHKGAKEGDAE